MPRLLNGTGGTRPRVCYLRGSYLNPFEAQYLVLLLDEFDLVIAHSRSHRYNLSDIPIELIELPCLDYLNGIIPRQFMGRTIPNPLKYLGFEEVLFKLDKIASSFDLIHLPEQSFYFTWQIAKRKKGNRFKMVAMQDEVNPFWYADKGALAGRAGLVRREVDLFIARSERARCALISEGVDEERVRVIGHGVDTDRFKPGERDKKLCREIGIEPDRFIILFVGRLFWTKGIFALADAAKLLLRDPEVRRLDPVFLLVGEGDERSGLEKRLEVLGISPFFKIIGNQPYGRLPMIHRLCDIFVLPSISTRYVLEQFGIVIIESMATGKPVVSTHCGAIDEVVGDAGILVQPNDSYRLYKALLKLCLNADLRSELGESGLARVRERFTHKRVASSIASAYRDVLEK